MNLDSKLIFESYLLNESNTVIIRKRTHDMEAPPERNPNKSQTYNKIIRLNHEFDREMRADPQYRAKATILDYEKYESIAYMTGTTIDQVKAAIKKGIDPKTGIYKPTRDPLQIKGTLTSEE